jgi:hypothetical protein
MMNDQLLVAMTALLSLVMACVVIGVIQLGCLISQLADMKAFVMTVISKMPTALPLPTTAHERIIINHKGQP